MAKIFVDGKDKQKCPQPNSFQNWNFVGIIIMAISSYFVSNLAGILTLSAEDMNEAVEEEYGTHLLVVLKWIH